MEKKRSGWRTFGIIAGVGCLSMIAVVVGGLIIATLWARATIRNIPDSDPRPVARDIEYPPPDSKTVARLEAEGKDVGAPLKLNLDLQEGNFTIRPGQPGSKITVEGEYAPGLYSLTDQSDTHAESGVTRTRIRFRSTAPTWARFFAGMGGGSNDDAPELTVTIPRGALLDLTLQLTMGRSEVDLGGLTLGQVTINATMGEHRIDFREPVTEAVRELRFNTSMGNVVIENLGNARAQSINATGSMGNVTASLGGAWAPGDEADVRFEQSMGELTVRVPSNVRVDADVRSSQGESSRAPVIKQPDDPRAPALRLRVTTSMGEARVIQY